MIVGPPRFPVQVPAAVNALASGAVVRPVWINGLGGLRFQIGSGGARRFVKWAPVESGIDLMAEGARLIWASRFVCVPRVLEHGSDEHGAWFVSTPIDGESAVSDRWKAEPARAVAAIGHGLRVLHDALPVNDCPFPWEAATRVADTRASARRQARPSSVERGAPAPKPGGGAERGR